MLTAQNAVCTLEGVLDFIGAALATVELTLSVNGLRLACQLQNAGRALSVTLVGNGNGKSAL